MVNKMNNFDRAFEMVIGHEGVMSRDPTDNGNWTGGAVGNGVLRGTKYGISAKSYPALDIENLTLDQAKAIYEKDYWNKVKCDEMPGPIALIVFDALVNTGRGAVWLQHALGVRKDGVVGPQTLAALKRAVEKDGGSDLIVEMLALRMVHNGDASTWEHHKLGWSRRVATLAFQCLTMDP